MIAIYARVSTDVQAEEGYSISEQVDRMQKFCDAMGWGNVQPYIDAGYSGANLDRPAIQDLIRDAKYKVIDRVVVLKLDRLSRSQMDTLYLIENVFIPNNVDFVSMSENFDTSSPFGKAMIGILSVFAQLEREQIKERMAMGRKGRSKKGLYHGGAVIPTGYDYEDGKLVVNEYEAMIIREIFRMYKQGDTYRNIARGLNKRGLVKRGAEWSDSRIRYIIHNPLYCGKIECDGEVYDGQHEPIISEEEFYDVLRIADLRNPKGTHKMPESATYLGGLVYCKQCGGRYLIGSTHNNGKLYRYYTCKNRKRRTIKASVNQPHCHNKPWRMENLDELVFAEIRKLAVDPDFVAQEPDEDNFREEQIAAIKQKIDSLNGQKSRYMELYSMSYFSVEELAKKIGPITKQLLALTNELNDIENAQNAKQQFTEQAKTFGAVIDTASPEEIRLLVRSLIKEIQLDGENIEIYWRFQ